MKGLVRFAALICASVALTKAQEPARAGDGGAIERAKHLVRSDHAYDPTARATPEIVGEPSPDTVVMDAVTVTESMTRRYLESAIERDRIRRERDTFSFVRGGALLRTDIGKARLEVGTWGTGAGLNLLKLSW